MPRRYIWITTSVVIALANAPAGRAQDPRTPGYVNGDRLIACDASAMIMPTTGYASATYWASLTPCKLRKRAAGRSCSDGEHIHRLTLQLNGYGMPWSAS